MEDKELPNSWFKLVYARTWDDEHKKGDFTDTYITKSGNYIIEPYNGQYRLIGNNDETLLKHDYGFVEGDLETLLAIDIEKNDPPFYMVLSEEQLQMIESWNMEYDDLIKTYSCPYKLISTDKPNVFQVVYNNLENGNK